MFERFTERGRMVIVLAQSQSRDMKDNCIGTEHMLLGLISEEEGVAAQALKILNVTETIVKEQIDSSSKPSGKILPFTPMLKEVLELSLREALSLGHNYIGTEHLLLALVRREESTGCKILLSFGIDAEKVRNVILGLISKRTNLNTKKIDSKTAAFLMKDFVDNTRVVKAEKKSLDNDLQALIQAGTTFLQVATTYLQNREAPDAE